MQIIVSIALALALAGQTADDGWGVLFAASASERHTVYKPVGGVVGCHV